MAEAVFRCFFPGRVRLFGKTGSHSRESRATNAAGKNALSQRRNKAERNCRHTQGTQQIKSRSCRTVFLCGSFCFSVLICTPNTGHLVWGYFYALDLLSQVKKLAQHSNSIFAIFNSQLLPTNQICGLLSYPKKTKNPNPSPIGNRFGFFLFGGRGWIRTTEAEKQQIYSLSPLATREHAHIQFFAVADCLYILPLGGVFVNCFLQLFQKRS